MHHTAILKALMLTPGPGGNWGLPATFWGRPGVGKTAEIERLGREFGVPVETLSPSERGEGAFGVTPVPDTVPVEQPDGSVEAKSFIGYPPPAWVEQFDRAQRGIVFVDEIGSCDPRIQPALLGLIQSRRIGGAYLGRGVRVFGAANPVEDAAGGWDLAPAVANRMGHFAWDPPSGEEWADWLLGAVDGNGGATADLAAEEKRVVEAWPKPWARARGVFAGFVKRRPDLLHAQPKAGDPQASRAWPSPRSMELACRAFAAGDLHALDETLREELVAGFIGSGATCELFAWQRAADLPDPGDLLDGKVTWEYDPHRLDVALAVLASCTATVAPREAPKRTPRTEVLWGLLAQVSKSAKDIVIGPAKVLVNAGLAGSKAADPVMTSLWPILQASGYKGAR